MKNYILLIIFLFIGIISFGQDQLWTQSVSKNAFMSQLDDGSLFIKDKKSISLIDHISGEQKWQSEVATERDPIFLNSLPLMYFVDKGFSLINAETGDVVQKLEGRAEILNTSYYWDEGRVVIEIDNNKMLKIVNIDLNDLSKSWNQEIGKVRKSFMGLVKNSTENKPYIGNDGSLILVDVKYIHVLGLDGSIKSKIDFKKDVTKEGFNPANNILYVLEDKKKLHFINVKTGEIVSTKELKEKKLNLTVLKSGDNIAITQKKDLVLLNGTSGKEVARRSFKDGINQFYKDQLTEDFFVLSKKLIEHIDPSNGETLRKKELEKEFKKLYAINDQLIISGKGYSNVLDLVDLSMEYSVSPEIYQIDDIIESGNKKIYVSKLVSKSSVTVLDNKGSELWSTSFNSTTNPTIFPVKRGLVAITGQSVMYLGLKDGKSLWDKPKNIKVDPSFEYELNDDNSLMVFYSDKRLYMFNLNTGKLIKSEEKFKLKDFDYESQKPQIMVLEDNIFLKGSRSIFTADHKGNLKTRMDYKPVSSKSSLMSFATAAVTVAAVATGNADQVLTVYSGGEQVHKGSMVDGLNETWAAADRAKQERQMKQNKSSNAYPYVYTKLKSKKKGLIFLDPTTGDELKEVTMDDKDPTYIVDEIDGILFHLSKGVITAVDIK